MYPQESYTEKNYRNKFCFIKKINIIKINCFVSFLYFYLKPIIQTFVWYEPNNLNTITSNCRISFHNGICLYKLFSLKIIILHSHIMYKFGFLNKRSTIKENVNHILSALLRKTEHILFSVVLASFCFLILKKIHWLLLFSRPYAVVRQKLNR